jgi:hypothetical protein
LRTFSIPNPSPTAYQPLILPNPNTKPRTFHKAEKIQEFQEIKRHQTLPIKALPDKLNHLHLIQRKTLGASILFALKAHVFAVPILGGFGIFLFLGTFAAVPY